MDEKHETPASVLTGYDKSHWHEPTPVLSEEDVQVALGELTARNMVRQVSVLPLGTEAKPIDTLRDYSVRRIMERNAGSIIGPLFLEGKYVPNGIAIWVPARVSA